MHHLCFHQSFRLSTTTPRLFVDPPQNRRMAQWAVATCEAALWAVLWAQWEARWEGLWAAVPWVRDHTAPPALSAWVAHLADSLWESLRGALLADLGSMVMGPGHLQGLGRLDPLEVRGHQASMARQGVRPGRLLVLPRPGMG